MEESLRSCFPLACGPSKEQEVSFVVEEIVAQKLVLV
jgi:hypothetical protein